MNAKTDTAGKGYVPNSDGKIFFDRIPLILDITLTPTFRSYCNRESQKFAQTSDIEHSHFGKEDLFVTSP